MNLQHNICNLPPQGAPDACGATAFAIDIIPAPVAQRSQFNVAVFTSNPAASPQGRKPGSALQEGSAEQRSSAKRIHN